MHAGTGKGEKMLFSIITAAYNAQDDIEKTIQSVLRQNHRTMLAEHVIVDGASTDATVDIIRDYARRYPEQVRFLSEPDAGLYDALNKGVLLAKGDYVNVQGAGDCLNDGALEKLARYAGQAADIIYGKEFEGSYGFTIGQEADSYCMAKDGIHHQSMFVSRRVYSQYVYNLKYPIKADYDYMIRIWGNPAFVRQFVDITVGCSKGNGISVRCNDNLFTQEKAGMIRRYLGEDCYRWYIESGNAAWYFKNNFTGDIVIDENSAIVNGVERYPDRGMGHYKQFLDYANNARNETVCIFGTGGRGRAALDCLLCNPSLTIEAFLDNAPEKWGKTVAGYRIQPPRETDYNRVDRIIIASNWKIDIREQLMGLGVQKEKLIISG